MGSFVLGPLGGKENGFPLKAKLLNFVGITLHIMDIRSGFGLIGPYLKALWLNLEASAKTLKASGF